MPAKFGFCAMLYRLEIENFYSIRAPQAIDLRVGPGVAGAGRLAPIWRGATERAPKVVALFGANASGKSNVLKALAFVAWFIRHSFSAPRGNRLPFDRFNDTDSLRSPTRLAVHIGGIEDIARTSDPEAGQCGYIYEVVIGGETTTEVFGEALYYRPAGMKRRTKLFERDTDGGIVATRAFGLAGYRQTLEKVLRPDASVIATLAQLDHPFATAIWKLAATVTGNILVERIEDADDNVVRLYAEYPPLLERLNQEIERIDLGIRSIHVQPGPQGPIASFAHHGLAVPMPMSYQSHGTRQFLKLFPFLLSALERGGIAVLDELDAAIHPLILPEIIRWFHDPARNPHDAQLWMTCQNASLLEDLSKDEVLFCDKDGRGRTEVYGLRDIQAVRRTDNYYRKYLGGAYGAIPQIG